MLSSISPKTPVLKAYQDFFDKALPVSALIKIADSLNNLLAKLSVAVMFSFSSVLALSLLCDSVSVCPKKVTLYKNSH